MKYLIPILLLLSGCQLKEKQSSVLYTASKVDSLRAGFGLPEWQASSIGTLGSYSINVIHSSGDTSLGVDINMPDSLFVRIRRVDVYSHSIYQTFKSDTIYIHDTIYRNKSTHINSAQSVIIGGDINGEIIQRGVND